MPNWTVNDHDKLLFEALLHESGPAIGKYQGRPGLEGVCLPHLAIPKEYLGVEYSNLKSVCVCVKGGVGY